MTVSGAAWSGPGRTPSQPCGGRDAASRNTRRRLLQPAHRPRPPQRAGLGHLLPARGAADPHRPDRHCPGLITLAPGVRYRHGINAQPGYQAGTRQPPRNPERLSSSGGQIQPHLSSPGERGAVHRVHAQPTFQLGRALPQPAVQLPGRPPAPPAASRPRHFSPRPRPAAGPATQAGLRLRAADHAHRIALCPGRRPTWSSSPAV
jgi:hypothetical protein